MLRHIRLQTSFDRLVVNSYSLKLFLFFEVISLLARNTISSPVFRSEIGSVHLSCNNYLVAMVLKRLLCPWLQMCPLQQFDLLVPSLLEN